MQRTTGFAQTLAMAVCAEAKTRWHSPIGDNAREELEDTVVFMLAAFGAGLRGEEVLLISLDGLLSFWDETRLDEDSHVMLTLKGRFKGEVDERWHLVPISDATRSGLPFRKWMERVLHRRVNLQVQESGWLFQDRRGARLKFGQYDPLYRALIRSSTMSLTALLFR